MKTSIHQLLQDFKEISIVADDYRDERQDIEEEELEDMWRHEPGVKDSSRHRRFYLHGRYSK